MATANYGLLVFAGGTTTGRIKPSEWSLVTNVLDTALSNITKTFGNTRVISGFTPTYTAPRTVNVALGTGYSGIYYLKSTGTLTYVFAASGVGDATYKIYLTPSALGDGTFTVNRDTAVPTGSLYICDVAFASNAITSITDQRSILYTTETHDHSGGVKGLQLTNSAISSSAAIAYSKLNLTGSIVNADINASAAIVYSKLSLANSILNADINTAAAIAYSKLALTGSIVNADVNASAAIAYSKLALTGSIVNADIGASAAIAYSKLALTGAIVNADISGSAAIAYSKLALGTSIVNADISTSAAIVYSKLNLTGNIVNADINASAAIVYSKLSLAGSIVNADIASGAAIAYSKLNFGTGTIVNADVAPTAGIVYSKLSLTGGIVNADVSGSAAIAYSKLNLATSIVNADINASAAIVYSKLSLTGSIVKADLAAGAAKVNILDKNTVSVDTSVHQIRAGGGLDFSSISSGIVKVFAWRVTSDETASATSVATISKAIPVYDSSANLLGYVPIYNTYS